MVVVFQSIMSNDTTAEIQKKQEPRKTRAGADYSNRGDHTGTQVRFALDENTRMDGGGGIE